MSGWEGRQKTGRGERKEGREEELPVE